MKLKQNLKSKCFRDFCPPVSEFKHDRENASHFKHAASYLNWVSSWSTRRRGCTSVRKSLAPFAAANNKKVWKDDQKSWRIVIKVFCRKFAKIGFFRTFHGRLLFGRNCQPVFLPEGGGTQCTLLSRPVYSCVPYITLSISNKFLLTGLGVFLYDVIFLLVYN